MAYPYWAMLTLPYARLELPGWGHLLTWMGVFDNGRWDGAPARVIRGKLHGYRMRLNLSSWSERQTYFLGRYYDLQTQLFLRASLRPGETLIDVGGNIGMMTLLGARLVGAQGCVITFEPNPEACGRIEESLRDNAIEHVTLHRAAASNAPGRLVLSVITDHSGMGTLAEVEEKDAALITAKHEVEVVCGDSLVPTDLRRPVTMKFDVEGFECRALGGFLETIRRYHPVIATEVVGHHLHRAGHTVGELCELLHREGYRGYVMSLRRRGFGQKLTLHSMQAPDESMDHDVAWVYPGSEHESRLAPCIAG